MSEVFDDETDFSAHSREWLIQELRRMRWSTRDQIAKRNAYASELSSLKTIVSNCDKCKPLG